MHPAETLRGFLTALWHLPFLFQLVLLWMFAGGTWQWWKSRRQDQLLAASANWPTHRARVVSAQVLDQRPEGEDGTKSWEGLLTYSYTFPGHELEVGESRRRFFDPDEAEAWARTLRDTFVDVRVNPENPSQSVWQESTFVYAPVQPSFQNVTIDKAGTGVWTLPALVILCFSSIGAALAAWIQLSSLAGKPAIALGQKGGTVFGLMHVGAIVCSIAASLVLSRATRSSFRTQRQLLEKGSIGARFLQALGIYYLLVFGYGWVRSASAPHKSTEWVVLMFSAAWLLFYTTAAITAWKAMHPQPPSPPQP